MENEVGAPDIGRRSLREAPRVEEVIVTAPRPQKQNIRNPLQDVISNYYRALARRRTFNALVARHSRMVAQQQSWNQFANTAGLFASGAAMGGIAGIGGRMMFAGFVEGVATQAGFDLLAGNQITAQNLLISGGVSTVSGPIFGTAGNLTGSTAGRAIWHGNSKTFDTSVWLIGQ